ncbi:MAG: hypothetical protein J0L97_06035, partial [Alphaproteobacteria bacterium]|nr:hypothetical protein [Alphaproteobacteria bacterium]
MTSSSAVPADAPSPAAPGQAAIYFLSEGFDTTGAKLMGRHVAGEEFLRGFARYSSHEDIYCYTSTKPMFDDFTRRVDGFVQAENGQSFPTRRMHFVPFANPTQIEKPGCLFLPGPGLGEYAWHRRRLGAKRYSLCGVTHTTASDGAVAGIAEDLTAPIQKWDALICTSSVVRKTVD